ncbi:hypothetical protein [Kribbella sp. NPDC055071]
MSERNIQHNDFDPHDKGRGGRNADKPVPDRDIAAALGGSEPASKATKQDKNAADDKAATKQGKSIGDRLLGK